MLCNKIALDVYATIDSLHITSQYSHIVTDGIVNGVKVSKSYPVGKFKIVKEIEPLVNSFLNAVIAGDSAQVHRNKGKDFVLYAGVTIMLRGLYG